MPERKSVAELVARFEKWNEGEESEQPSVKKPNKLVAAEPGGVKKKPSKTSLAPPGEEPYVCPEGDEVLSNHAADDALPEALREAHAGTPSEAGDSVAAAEPEGEVLEIEAYWDEESKTYWYQDEATGEFFQWSEEAQDYVPWKPTPKAAEATVPMSEYEQIGVDMKLDLVDVRALRKGLPAFAFVKANGGMLKPVTLYLNVVTGKLFVVRGKRSHFLHVQHFAELNKSKQALDFIKSDTDQAINETVEVLLNQPYMAITTNDVFVRAATRQKGFLPQVKQIFTRKKSTRHKTLVFVFENTEARDGIFKILKQVGKHHDSKISTVE